MNIKMADVLLHIDENTSKEQRESLRDTILVLDGVMSADYKDDRPHLMIVGYDPDVINSSKFLSAVNSKGLHAELIGL
ncbi:MAG: ATP-binding protein [Gammaproteobacteria bacterium]|nr:ATP-binding protein [Gammaproteobacteria bacterium]MDH5776629.1 ATP-binding protein [Gammaproteobacteria bacterium]